MSRHFSIKNIFPRHSVGSARPVYRSSAPFCLVGFDSRKKFPNWKKRRNKKICVHVCYYNPAPLRDPAWLLSLYYRSSSSSSSRLLYTDNDGGALETGYCGVQSSGQCLFYFIFLQLIFRQRPPVTWGGGIVSKTGETKTNSTGFIYWFFCCCCFDCYKTQKKRKRKRETLLK